MGIEPASLDEKAKRVALLRMVPFVERNYNLVEHVRGAKAHSFRVHRNEVKAPRGGAECPGTGSKQKGRTESFGLEADFRSFGVGACRRRPEKLVGQVRQKQSGGGGRVGESVNGGEVRASLCSTPPIRRPSAGDLYVPRFSGVVSLHIAERRGMALGLTHRCPKRWVSPGERSKELAARFTKSVFFHPGAAPSAFLFRDPGYFAISDVLGNRSQGFFHCSYRRESTAGLSSVLVMSPFQEYLAKRVYESEAMG